MSAGEATCLTCRFYSAQLSDDGVCRRRAPEVGKMTGAGIYPLTRTDGWCGEYELPLKMQRAKARQPSGHVVCICPRCSAKAKPDCGGNELPMPATLQTARMRTYECQQCGEATNGSAGWYLRCKRCHRILCEACRDVHHGDKSGK